MQGAGGLLVAVATEVIDPGHAVLAGEGLERPLAVGHRRRLAAGQPHTTGHVQSDPPGLHPGVEHDLRRFRIAPDVELTGHPRCVGAAQEHPAHDHQLLERGGEPGLQPHGQRDVGQRTDRDQGQLAGGGQHLPDQGHRRRSGLGRAAPYARRDGSLLRSRPQQRTVSTAVDGDLGPPDPVQQLQCQDRRRVDVGVAVHGGDQPQVESRVGQRHGQCEAVVDVAAGRTHGQVGIEDDRDAHACLLAPIFSGSADLLDL